MKGEHMILPVEIYGSPVLRKVSEEIDEDNEGLTALIANMYETMRKADGIGLAAPQVGKNIRVVVIDADPMKKDDSTLAGFRRTLINPEITEYWGEKWSFNEGCLSLPGIREDVTRPGTIRLEYDDEHFHQQEEVFEGVKARILQHEIDHLEGVLFVDRISALRRKLLKRKLNDITKGKVDIGYKIRVPK